MVSALLDITRHDNGSYYFDNAAESLIYAVIGLVVVFVGIALLIAILYLVGFIIKKAENARRAAAGRVAVPPQDEKAAEDEIPQEIKAAIVAAVMSYYAEEKPHCDFVVKRIKRL